MYAKYYHVHVPVQTSFFEILIPGVTCEAGTSYPSGILELTPGIIGVRIALSLVLCVLFCSFCVIALSNVIIFYCDKLGNRIRHKLLQLILSPLLT